MSTRKPPLARRFIAALLMVLLTACHSWRPTFVGPQHLRKGSGKMGKSRKLPSPRLVALLILPCFLAACTSWQPLRMSNLRATMREYQPDRIQLLLRTESFGGEIVLSNPQVYGDAPMDTIGGILQDVGQVGIRNLSTTMGHSTGLIREQCPVW